MMYCEDCLNVVGLRAQFDWVVEVEWVLLFVMVFFV